MTDDTVKLGKAKKLVRQTVRAFHRKLPVVHVSAAEGNVFFTDRSHGHGAKYHHGHDLYFDAKEVLDHLHKLKTAINAL
jgi:hypothetical protein